jgi:hypothetical protein
MLPKYSNWLNLQHTKVNDLIKQMNIATRQYTKNIRPSKKQKQCHT